MQFLIDGQQHSADASEAVAVVPCVQHGRAPLILTPPEGNHVHTVAFLGLHVVRHSQGETHCLAVWQVADERRERK